jgi:hypothetical protein
VPLAWFAGGRLLSSSDDARMPFLPLGADSYGRDVCSRLLYGARISLGLSLVAAAGALLLGALLGGIAGYAGGFVDDLLMRASDFVLVLPAMYVALALRSMLRLVLPPFEVFLLLTGIFAVVGAPFIARGVRSIVRSEKQRDYARRGRVARRRRRASSCGTSCRPRAASSSSRSCCWCRRSSSPKRRCHAWASAFRIRSRAECCTTRPPFARSPISRGCSVRRRRCSSSCSVNLVMQHQGIVPVYNVSDESARRLRAHSNPVRS